MLKERQCKMRIYVCGGRQRNTGPLITWCCRRGSKLQWGFKSSLWQRKGPEETWLFWSGAEGLELGKDYRNALQIACFPVNLGRAPRLKDLIFSLFIIPVKVSFGVCFWWPLPSGFSLSQGDPQRAFTPKPGWVLLPSVQARSCSKIVHSGITVDLQ